MNFFCTFVPTCLVHRLPCSTSCVGWLIQPSQVSRLLVWISYDIQYTVRLQQYHSTIVFVISYDLWRLRGKSAIGKSKSCTYHTYHILRSMPLMLELHNAWYDTLYCTLEVWGTYGMQGLKEREIIRIIGCSQKYVRCHAGTPQVHGAYMEMKTWLRAVWWPIVVLSCTS